MNDKKVSVIISTYNNEKTIKLCLEAIEKNNYKNYEIIVVDDGSSDKSVEIAEQFPCKVLRTGVNGGPSVTRNLGAKHAEGEILFYLDGDIAMFPDAIENAVEEFGKSDEIGSVCGYHAKTSLIKDSLIKEYRNMQSHYWKKTSEGFATILSVAIGAIRKDVFFEIGGFNPELRQSEDVEFGDRISGKYKILITPRVMGYHDGDNNPFIVFKKLFMRASARVPLFFERKGFMPKFETPSRSAGIILAFLALMLLPLGILDPRLMFISLGTFIGFLLTDFGQYAYVFKESHILFALYFTFTHWFANMVMFAGLVHGTLSWFFKWGQKAKSYGI